MDNLYAPFIARQFLRLNLVNPGKYLTCARLCMLREIWLLQCRNKCSQTAAAESWRARLSSGQC